MSAFLVTPEPLAPSVDAALVHFLEGIKLHEYASKLTALGYDMTDFSEFDAEDIKWMRTALEKDATMPVGHIDRLLRKIRQLRLPHVPVDSCMAPTLVSLPPHSPLTLSPPPSPPNPQGAEEWVHAKDAPRLHGISKEAHGLKLLKRHIAIGWHILMGQVFIDHWTGNTDAKDLQKDLVEISTLIAQVAALFLTCVAPALLTHDIFEASEGNEMLGLAVHAVAGASTGALACSTLLATVITTIVHLLHIEDLGSFVDNIPRLLVMPMVLFGCGVTLAYIAWILFALILYGAKTAMSLGLALFAVAFLIFWVPLSVLVRNLYMASKNRLYASEKRRRESEKRRRPRAKLPGAPF